MNIFDLPRTEEECLVFLQNKGILPKQLVKLCTKRVNIRTGTWFSVTRLPFITAVRFFYSWAFEWTSFKWCKRELQITEHTTVEWNLYMRSACVVCVARLMIAFSF